MGQKWRPVRVFCFTVRVASYRHFLGVQKPILDDDQHLIKMVAGLFRLHSSTAWIPVSVTASFTGASRLAPLARASRSTWCARPAPCSTPSCTAYRPNCCRRGRGAASSWTHRCRQKALLSWSSILSLLLYPTTFPERTTVHGAVMMIQGK